jgi:thiol-disulfide isomerase/thioredoxin
VRLEEFQGRDTLLVFWNSHCGFCRRMLSELERWEREAAPTAPRLVLASALPKDAVPSLQAPVLFDEGFAAGRAFGVRGTPSAVLLDAEGRVASSVAVGGAEVLELAKGSAPRPVSISAHQKRYSPDWPTG